MNGIGKMLITRPKLAAPFGQYRQEAVFSDGGPQSIYLGRVVVELWNSPANSRGLSPEQLDAAGLAVVLEPTGEVGDSQRLLQRVMAALPQRFAK